MSEPLEIISLVRADLLKAQKNPTNWIVISIAAALTTMGVFNERSLSFRAFGFPDGLLVGPENVGPLLALVIMPIGAISAGVEYRYDTWKNLLTRRPGRAGFIIGKMDYFRPDREWGDGNVVVVVAGAGRLLGRRPFSARSFEVSRG